MYTYINRCMYIHIYIYIYIYVYSNSSSNSNNSFIFSAAGSRAPRRPGGPLA